MEVAKVHGNDLKVRDRAALVVVALLVLAACGSGSRDAPRQGEAGRSCPLTEETSGPPVSFELELVPFFSVTCAFLGCHDGSTRQAGLFLGPNFNDGPADAATRVEILASLLAGATTTPDLPRITPFEPERSFLLLKVQGCQNDLGLSCDRAVPGEPCGARMPYLSPELAPEQRAMIARWIAQGAPGP